MMLVCPSCESRYMLGDDAIGPQGRQVRCANCAHEWFQEPQENAALDVADGDEEDIELDAIDVGADESDAPIDADALEALFDNDMLPSTEDESETGDQAEAETEDDDDDVSISGEAEEEISLPSAGEGDDDDIEIAVEPPDEAALDGEDIPDAVKPLPEDADASPMAQVVDKAAAAHTLKQRLGGYGAALCVFLCLFGVLIALKGPLFKAYPPIALLYTLVGVDVDLPGNGLVIEKLNITQKTQDGAEQLHVKGKVINLKRVDQEVPFIMATLRDEEGVHGKSWLIEPPFEAVAGEQSFEFENTYMDVPEGTYSVSIKFAPFSEPAQAEYEDHRSEEDHEAAHTEEQHDAPGHSHDDEHH